VLRPRFDCSPVRVGFVVDRVALLRLPPCPLSVHRTNVWCSSALLQECKSGAAWEPSAEHAVSGMGVFWSSHWPEDIGRAFVLMAMNMEQISACACSSVVHLNFRTPSAYTIPDTCRRSVAVRSVRCSVVVQLTAQTRRCVCLILAQI